LRGQRQRGKITEGTLNRELAALSSVLLDTTLIGANTLISGF